MWGQSFRPCLQRPQLISAKALFKDGGVLRWTRSCACSATEDAWGNWGGDASVLGKSKGNNDWGADDDASRRGRKGRSERSAAFLDNNDGEPAWDDEPWGERRGGARGRYTDDRSAGKGRSERRGDSRGASRNGRRSWSGDDFRGRQRDSQTLSEGRSRGERRDSGPPRRDGGVPDGGRPRRGRFVDKHGIYREDWEAQVASQEMIREARASLEGGDLVYGVAPTFAALDTSLTSARRRLHALFVQDSMDMSKRKDAVQVIRIREMAERLGVPIKYTSKHVLNDLAEQRPHQGLLLDCDPLPWAPLDTLPPAAEAMAAAADGASPPVWLVMDQVFDPQNLGAMVRSAYFLGATGVLGSAKNCAPLSAVASKASAGTLEVWELHDSSNLAKTLERAVQDGWQVLGADAGPEAVSCSEVQVDKPTLLVMGNEGYGLRTNVRRACTGLVKIDAANASKMRIVDSLNVSVATGILLHHLITASRPK